MKDSFLRRNYLYTKCKYLIFETCEFTTACKRDRIYFSSLWDGHVGFVVPRISFFGEYPVIFVRYFIVLQLQFETRLFIANRAWPIFCRHPVRRAYGMVKKYQLNSDKFGSWEKLNWSDWYNSAFPSFFNVTFCL